MPDPRAPAPLAVARTRAASRQSYLTIRFLTDRAYRADAFALYAYFRWLDDMVDEHLGDQAARLEFVARQRALLAGGGANGLVPEERLLVGLARPDDDDGEAGGLRRSLTSMLDVMDFDARRRGQPVTAGELDHYTHVLAVAVTEALHHCIGHGCGCPHDETRYVAVTGAHIAHMLRDLAEDLAAGYRNVPVEVLATPTLDAPELVGWVRDRVALARDCFAIGRTYLARVESRRCRVAGHAYLARFEWVLDAIERDGYRLRPGYPERSTLRGGLAIAARGLSSAVTARRPGVKAPEVVR